MAKSYTGIDVGGRTLKMAVCEGGYVSKSIVEPLPEGLVDDRRIVSYDALADFVKETARAHGGVAKDVAMVLSPHESLVRRLKMPLMTEKEAALNLPYEFRDYISQGKDRYFYDYAVLGPVVDDQGALEGMDVLACAAPKSVIADLDAMCSRAGLRLRVAMPPAAALQDAVALSRTILKDFCIVDFAHGETRLHFFAGGLYDVTRTIEVGGRDVAQAIADACGVDERVASEHAESDFQGCLELPPVHQVFEGVAVEVSRSLNFYGFNNPDVELSYVFCIGSGPQQQMLTSLLKDSVGLKVRPAADLLSQPDETGLLADCVAAVGATVKAR